MSLLFVDDNRDALNWGCRSTSIALGQILLPAGITGSIPYETAHQRHPVGSFTRLFLRNRYTAFVWRRVLDSRAMRTAYQIVGDSADFVTVTPSVSVSRFLRAANRDHQLGELRRRFCEADTVVINGEGSLIFRNPPRRDLSFQLFTVELAHYLQKPVYYVNAMASYCPISGTNPTVESAVVNTLGKCKAVATRDPISSDILRSLGLRNTTWYPDALFSWSLRYKRFFQNATLEKFPELFDTWPESDRFLTGWSDWPDSYICISGASRPPGVDPKKWPPFFEELIHRIKDELKVQVVLVDPAGDGYLEDVATKTKSLFIRPQINILIGAYILANAKAYLSGRYHPSILASMGGTPCVFLESNSHKTYSLQSVLGYEHPEVFAFNASEENLNSIVEAIKAGVTGGEKLRHSMIQRTEILGTRAVEGISSMISGKSLSIKNESRDKAG